MNENIGAAGSKRGYLKGDFELFHLKDQKNMQFEFHYHDFNKILIFISGNVTYLIEGRAYRLKPWDILLINNREVHKPVIQPDETYERIVIWVNHVFLEKHSISESNLLTCFDLALSKKHNLLRLNPELLRNIRLTLSQLEEACTSKDFGSRILKNSLFMQLIVHINRRFLGSAMDDNTSDVDYDENTDRILNYINDNLGEDLSIDTLSAKFFISKYYLMHKFKMQTGYSIHSYILQKRLIMANSLIKEGKPAMEVSAECGFGDYSNFVRSFKKMFGASPREYYKNMQQLEKHGSGEKHF